MAPLQDEEQNSVEWYAMCAVILGSVACLVAAAVGAYKCYFRKPGARSPAQLSAAIKRGGKDAGGGSIRGTSGGMRSTNTPVRGFRSGSRGQTSPEAGSADRRLSTSPSGGIAPTQFGAPTQHGGAHSPGSSSAARSPSDQSVSKPEYHVEKECDKIAVSPTEKDVSLRETDVDELKRTKLGHLYFAIEYDHSRTALIVTVTKATDLPVKDTTAMTSDPYIKLQLLPDKRHKVKTRVLRKTLNPVYEEIFTFYGINFNQLQTITLHFAVLSFDRFSRDDVIGEVLMPLQGHDFHTEGGEMMLCKEIQPRHMKIHSHGRGELLVSLCYQPAANRLTVVVLKARNLPKMDITGLSDPYIKVYLLYNGQRIAKKKTHVKKRTLNPVYNESFLFDVPCNEGLQNISLEFLVLDWDRMTKNEVIGRLEIGSGLVQKASTPPGGEQTTTNPAAHHWSEVMNCPRKQIAEWHKLKE